MTKYIFFTIQWFLMSMVLSASAFAEVEITYFHSDILGNPIAATDGAGKVVFRKHYAPFGEEVDAQGTPPSGKADIGFTGHRKDERLGFVYMGARYYNPGIGVFLSRDPAGVNPADPFTVNRYAYANQNPYRYVDPDGRKVRFAQGSTPLFKKQFGQAIKYLNKKGAANSFAKLEKLPQTVLIKQPAAGSNDMYYNPNNKNIVWDPLSALETTAGGKQTPALGLGHEGEHALGDLTGTGASTANIPGDPYDTAEEKRVINGYETPAAKRLGEGTRVDHSAKKVYQSKCPTCIK